MSKQDDASRAAILARLAEVERICGVRPGDPEPETALTIQVLAKWVADLQHELRSHGHRFDQYVSQHDPKERLP